MKTHKWDDRTAKMSSERRERIRRGVEEDLLEMDLRAIREMAGKTQGEVADATDMRQGNISKLEKNGSRRLDIIARYVEALGGEVEVRANFGDKSVRLHVDL